MAVNILAFGPNGSGKELKAQLLKKNMVPTILNLAQSSESISRAELNLE